MKQPENPTAPLPLRLNIGCGNKFYPANEGWVNVDLVEHPKRPKENCQFVEDDIRSLSKFADDVVTEIHAIHVVEHFHIWEVDQVLANWRRVLVPGGKLVLEQPDVIKCAINLLQAATTKKEVIHFNLGLLGFYGESNADNPLNAHKWGWYPESLAQRLIKAGFTTVNQEPAQTHMREQRDFRLVAFK